MNKESNIGSWVTSAKNQLLKMGIVSAQLDAEIILAHTLRKNRTYIHAHGDEAIDPRYLDILDTRLALRLDRVPVAYIVGHKEFYSRHFTVTPSTLIPRPESEAMIDLLKEIANQPELPLTAEAPKLVDSGTGSGCLGITAKLELPELDVTLLDTSRHALNVAQNNARRLKADATVLKSNLLKNYPFKAHYMLANLPYVSETQEVSPETRHEPKEALYAGNDGVALIFRLLEEAPSHLVSGGSILIEAEPRQHKTIKEKAVQEGFKSTAQRGFILSFRYEG